MPASYPDPLLYHILGDYDTFPDFAVWEEDYMEFICGLIESRDRKVLVNLFRTFSERSLLLLGAPSEDWIVRFFLRAARGSRLSDLRKRDYLADHRDSLGKSMIFFFDKGVKTTRIIDGSPTAFVTELTARWRKEFSGGSDDARGFLERQPDEMPRGSVFISYAREDIAVAVQLGQALTNARIPVWLDKQRLQPGENYERSLEQTIKDSASFFLSLISKATESNPDRYVHKERAWAAQKHVDGWVYYIPLIIDDIPDHSISLEPSCFKSIHRERMAAATLNMFVRRIQTYVEQYKDSGRPRG